SIYKLFPYTTLFRSVMKQCYRCDEGDESDRGGYASNRDLERERVADDPNNREGCQRIPEPRWEGCGYLPRLYEKQVEARDRHSTNQQVRLQILTPLPAVVAHRRSFPLVEERKGPLNRSTTS